MDKFEEDEEEEMNCRDRFDEDIHKYIEEILHSRNRSEAIFFRSNALQFLDQWRFQRIEHLDHRVRTAGQLILNAFDQYQSMSNEEKKISFERISFRSTTTC